MIKLKEFIQKEESGSQWLIMHRDYYQPLCSVYVEVAFMDFAVNSGKSRATKYLQRCVGTKVDGIIGMKTYDAVYMTEDKKALAIELCMRRINFLNRNGHGAIIKRVTRLVMEIMQ
jgi:lysozyme family protein